MNVRFWGTRGSIATPGRATVRYGGNTSCVQVTSEQGTLLILDCGTGARVLGNHLLKRQAHPIRGHMFLTHTHWDHIQGFPFFAPVFGADNEFTIYGPADGEQHLEQALAGQMQYTYFPVELDTVGAALVCRNIGEGQFQLHDVTVSCQYLNHPALTLGYRFTIGHATLVYCTDHEPFSPVLFRPDTRAPSVNAILHDGDRRHAEFLAGADLVIHDAQYTNDEYEEKRNWGHSTIDYVVGICFAAGVKRLALFHHDPRHDDRRLDAIESQARVLVAEGGGTLEVFCAREGQSISLAEGVPVQRQGSKQPAARLQPQRRRVLVVDDDAMMRDLIEDILRVEGYLVDFARDGEEALAQVDTLEPDLVLLDVRLPKIDGLTVLERLRSSATTRDLPVIMLTADDDATEQGFKAGATDYMTKPFSPSQLRARVTSWVMRLDDAGGTAPTR